MTGIEIISAPDTPLLLTIVTVAALGVASIPAALLMTAPARRQPRSATATIALIVVAAVLVAGGVLGSRAMVQTRQAHLAAAYQTRAALEQRYDIEVGDDFDVDAPGTEPVTVHDSSSGEGLEAYVHNDGELITLLTRGPDGPGAELDGR